MSLASGPAQQFPQARLRLYEISHVQAERRVLVQNTAPLSELKRTTFYLTDEVECVVVGSTGGRRETMRGKENCSCHAWRWRLLKKDQNQGEVKVSSDFHGVS
ncbi:hypothetical protein EJB05_45143, partial [Eragrostis curvula]